MDFSSRVSHLAAFVAAVFALLLAAGCARITSLDLQLAPPGPADPSDEAGAEAQVAPGLALPVPGDILIVGGAGAARSTLASAEFFSAATGKFKPTATAMKTSRAVDALVAVPNPLHQAVVLGGMKGRGVSSIGALTLHAKVLNTAEAYNAVTGRFVP